MIERLYIKYALPMINCEDNRTFKKWCKNYGVEVFYDIGTNKLYVLKEKFEAALCITPNMAEHKKTEQATCWNNCESYNRHPMEPLYIPPGKRGHKLVVFCYRCQTNVYDTCKTTGKSLKKCPHGDRHIFKAYMHVKGSKNARKTKAFKTRILNEAIKELMNLNTSISQHEIKLGQNGAEIGSMSQDLKMPQLLSQVLEKYKAWIRNEDVPSHFRRERSDDHVKDIERACDILEKCLKEAKINLNELTIRELNDKIIGKVNDYFESRKFAPRTFNKYFQIYSSILKWYYAEFNLPYKNWFKRVPKKKTSYHPESIVEEVFEKLLSIINLKTVK